MEVDDGVHIESTKLREGMMLEAWLKKRYSGAKKTGIASRDIYFSCSNLRSKKKKKLF